MRVVTPAHNEAVLYIYDVKMMLFESMNPGTRALDNQPEQGHTQEDGVLPNYGCKLIYVSMLKIVYTQRCYGAILWLSHCLGIRAVLFFRA